MRKQQSGFTLIELVMVIVILGILAAFALPKFADLSGDAQTAVCRGGLAATKSGAGIAHAAWLAGGSSGAISLENTNYTLNAAGYPTAAQIEEIAGLDGFDVVVTAGTSTLVSVGTGAGLNSFTYTEATGTSVATALCQ